jgi:hypothetical protein
MEIGNLSIHIHKWVSDSQGAIYCQHCRKFKGWEPGEIHETYIAGVGKGRAGWGYLLNGEEWVKEKELQIRWNNGLYV